MLSIRIALLLLTFISTANMTWLSWLWHRHSDKNPLHSQHANYNQYQNGGSYPWPYHCSKPPLQPNPYVAQPDYAPYYYPVYLRTMLVKPIVPNVPIPFFPHQQKRTTAWRDQRLFTSNGLLRHNFGVRRGPIHSALPPQTGQPQPVVVAHNGIFILNNNAGTGSAEAIRVSRTKNLRASAEQSRQQLKAQPNALLIL